MMLAPAVASASVKARPSPVLPPVTTAFLPLMEKKPIPKSLMSVTPVSFSPDRPASEGPAMLQNQQYLAGCSSSQPAGRTFCRLAAASRHLSRMTARAAAPGAGSRRTSLRLQLGRESRGAQVRADDLLEHLDDRRRLRAAAVHRPCAREDLLGEAAKLERHPELTAHLVREEEVLAGQVQGEVDVVAAVQDELALGLVDEAVAGAGLDHVPGQLEVHAALLGEHQRLAVGHKMDEGQHVGDHLDH